MRDYTGIPYQIERDPIRRQSLMSIDYFLKDLNRGIARISKGQIPDGSGNAIPLPPEQGSLLDYLYLPGRAGGQTVHAVDSNPGVTFASLTSGLTVSGSIGDPIVRFGYGGSTPTALLDIRPYLFATNDVEAVFTNGATPAAGAPINFLSDDATSAFRIASTTNRTYLQAGLRAASGQIQNANITLGCAGARVGRHIAYEFQHIKLSNSGTVLYDGTAIAANTTKIGIGADPVTYTTWNDALLAKAPSTAGAAIALELSSYAGSNPGLVLRGGSTNILGVISTGPSLATIENNAAYARFMLWDGSSPGARVGGIGTNGTQPYLIDGSQNYLIGGARANAFADSVSSTFQLLGDANNVMLTVAGSNIITRLGISAASVIHGNNLSGRILAPASTTAATADLFNWVSSANPATLLSGIDSAGAYFLKASAAAGSLLQSNASGVGAWATTLTGNYTYSGTARHNGAVTVDTVPAPVSLLINNGGADQFLKLDDGIGNTLTFQTDVSIAGAVLLGVPAAGGTIVTTSAAQILTAKRISAGGTSLTGWTPATGGPTTLYTPTISGMFVVYVQLFCTTADAAAGSVTLTINWTDLFGATTQTTASLALTATGRIAPMEVILRRNSGNITFSTTLTGSAGTSKAAYYMHVMGQ